MTAPAQYATPKAIREAQRTRQHGTKVYRTTTGTERIAACREIVAARQYAKVDGTMVDLFTASAIVTVHDALNEKNQATFSALPIDRMGLVAFRLLPDWGVESPYDAAVAAGCEIDHHESDLYLKCSPEADAIVKRFGCSAERFRSQIDGALWWDIPFAFLPWWERRASK